MPKVKRPSSAWIQYGNDVRKSFQTKYPDLKMTELTKKISETWNSLTADQKKKYEDLAAKDKERYLKEKAEAGSDSSSDEDTKKGKKGKKGKGKGKAKKDPDAPKKSATAWILYLNDKRDETRKKKENEGKKITEITTIVSEMWKKESDASKAKYQKQADSLKEKYQKEKAAYDAKKAAESDSDSSSEEEAPPKKRAKKGSGKKKADSDSE